MKMNAVSAISGHKRARRSTLALFALTLCVSHGVLLTLPTNAHADACLNERRAIAPLTRKVTRCQDKANKQDLRASKVTDKITRRESRANTQLSRLSTRKVSTESQRDYYNSQCNPDDVDTLNACYRYEQLARKYDRLVAREISITEAMTRAVTGLQAKQQRLTERADATRVRCDALQAQLDAAQAALEACENGG